MKEAKAAMRGEDNSCKPATGGDGCQGGSNIGGSKDEAVMSTEASNNSNERRR